MIKCLQTYELHYCGDSIEWCPTEGYQHLLACGSYQLQPDSGHRVGRIDLFHYDDISFKLLQEIELEAGLLDAKWSPNSDTPFLAAALSNGILNIYKIENDNLKLISSLEVCSNGMNLSVDWSTGVKGDQNPRLIISQSNGYISIVQINQDGSLIIVNEFKGHDYEAWAAAFNYWNTNIIYSGGDDCKLNVYDLRRALQRPVHTNSTHTVGVTSLQTYKKCEGYLASSSYEDVRIWKTSDILLNSLDSIEMPGGSWRVKWNNSSGHIQLGVAAMHEGFTVINYTKNNNCNQDTKDILENCKRTRTDYKGPHSSLGYGVDWSYKDCSIIAFCSFYDKTVSISRTNI